MSSTVTTMKQKDSKGKVSTHIILLYLIIAVLSAGVIWLKLNMTVCKIQEDEAIKNKEMLINIEKRLSELDINNSFFWWMQWIPLVILILVLAIALKSFRFVQWEYSA